MMQQLTVQTYSLRGVDYFCRSLFAKETNLQLPYFPSLFLVPSDPEKTNVITQTSIISIDLKTGLIFFNTVTYNLLFSHTGQW